MLFYFKVKWAACIPTKQTGIESEKIVCTYFSLFSCCSCRIGNTSSCRFVLSILFLLNSKFEKIPFYLSVGKVEQNIYGIFSLSKLQLQSVLGWLNRKRGKACFGFFFLLRLQRSVWLLLLLCCSYYYLNGFVLTSNKSWFLKTPAFREKVIQAG